MAQAQRTTAQRFEVKYLLSESQACAICDYIEPWVQKDGHLGASSAYRLTSLYYDSPQLTTYWSSEYGEKNRFKVRVRRYDFDASLFLEIKRRTDRIIRKQRVPITEEDAEAFLRYNASLYSMTDGLHPAEREVCYAFRDLVDALGAGPRVLVRYEREAYVSALEEPVRLTFDRRLCCSPCFTYTRDLWSTDREWHDVEGYPIIFEVKFTNAFPGWVKRMIQRFGLSSCSVAKYVLAVDALNRIGIVTEGTGPQAVAASGKWGVNVAL